MLNQSGKLMNIFQTILQNHKLCCVLVQYCVLVPVWCGEGGCILGLAGVLTGRCARRGRGQGSPGAYRGSASQYPPDNITIIHTVSHCSALRPVNWLRDAAWDCKSNKHNLYVNHLIKLELVSFSLETIYCNTLSGRLRRYSWTPGHVLLLCPHQSSTAAVSGVLQLK